jgi:pimeloyl-ACP methyl ester carboxylesterase
LILIMGFGADGSLWGQHVDEYSKHFRCIMLDNRGVGLTDQPTGPYSTEMMADDTAGLMDALQIKRARVAGISMGGAIAQQLALRHAEKVRSLVLVSTWGKFDKYATMVYENLKKLRRVADPGDFMELLQLWIFATDYVEKNLDRLKEAQEAARNNPDPQSQQGFDGQLDACIGHNVVEQLPQIGAPTLIVVGVSDIFTPLPFSELLHERIPGSEIMKIPRTGHVCHWEALEEFNRRTTEFLLNH